MGAGCPLTDTTAASNTSIEGTLPAYDAHQQHAVGSHESVQSNLLSRRQQRVEVMHGFVNQDDLSVHQHAGAAMHTWEVLRDPDSAGAEPEDP